MGRGQKKYLELRNDKDIMRWCREVCSGSQITGNVYLRRLGSFCEQTGKTPHQLIKMNDLRLSNLISDVVRGMESKGYSGGYTKSVVKSVKSWLTYNGIHLQRKVKIKDAEDTPTLTEPIPDKDGLKNILNACDVRQKVAVSMIAFTGIRLQSLGNSEGNNGMRLSDIEDLVIQREEVSFRKIPAKVIVRKELSKKHHEYFTFLGKEGCDYLQVYLNQRIRDGEELTDNSALLTKSKLKLRRERPFITTIKVSALIRDAIRTAGYQNRPYDLRNYFASRMLMAESERQIRRDYRTFFMGHKGDIEHRYTTDRKLSNDLIEQMRDAYGKATEFLEPTPKPLSDKDKQSLEKSVTASVLRKVFKFSDSDIEDLLELSDEELQKRVADKIGRSEDKEKIKQKEQTDRREIQGRTNGSRQTIVPMNHVKTYISEGWEFVRDFDNEAIMRLP